MPEPLQLISTDFDGTIHTDLEHPPVPPALQQLIGSLQAQGVKWMINTGRDLPGVMETMARAQLTVTPDYLGLVEREIYAHDGARFVPLEDWNRACQRDQAAMAEWVRADVPALYRWITDRFQATVYEDAYSPFCVIAQDNGDMDSIMDQLEAYARNIPNLAVVRNDVYARFSHSAYDKGTVLGEVSRRLEIPPAAVLAAGDHHNDLPMLSRQYARWLVAPANAVRFVKEAVVSQNGLVSALPWGHGVRLGVAAAWEGDWPTGQATP